MMNAARFAVGLEGVAIAERAFQRALAFARERVQGRDVAGSSGAVPIIRHPDVRRMASACDFISISMRRTSGWRMSGTAPELPATSRP